MPTIKEAMIQYDSLSPELRALVGEYGLQTLLSARRLFKTDDPIILHEKLEKNRILSQKEIEKQTKNVGEKLREGMQKKL